MRSEEEIRRRLNELRQEEGKRVFNSALDVQIRTLEWVLEENIGGEKNGKYGI